MQPYFRCLRVAVATAVFGVILLQSGVVHAQGRDPVAATELFTQGREMLREGKVKKACSLFEESLRLDPKVGTALNLAECEERKGQLTVALRAWQQAINLARANDDEREQLAQQRYDALAPKVPRLAIALAPGSPSGAIVRRGEVELGPPMLGLSLPVDPGKHIITVRAPGHAPNDVVVELGVGQTRAITVSVGPPLQPVATTGPVVEKSVDAGSSNAFAYVLGSVGIAGMIAAAVTGGMLLDTNKKVKNHCDEQHRCDQVGLDAADRGKILVPINTVSWVVGVVGLGSGAYLLLSASSDSKPSSAGASGAFLQIQGTF
jgi:hypothetical protein